MTYDRTMGSKREQGIVTPKALRSRTKSNQKKHIRTLKIKR